MAATCPLCGAHYDTDETCDDRFNLALATEFEDAAYGAVHHLTVPSYLLQHNAYSRDGWIYSRELLSQFVRHGLTPADARRASRHQVASGNRTWSVTRGPKLDSFAEIVWTRTIADVRLDNAADYCADVRRWAEAVLTDTDAVAARESSAI